MGLSLLIDRLKTKTPLLGASGAAVGRGHFVAVARPTTTSPLGERVGTLGCPSQVAGPETSGRS
jgi:hypothetical protein